MKHYLIEYSAHGVGDDDYHESSRQEYPNRLAAIDALVDKVGTDNIGVALDANMAEQVFWLTEFVGYAIATDMEVDPLG